jgi:hypothetical protein
MRNKLFYRSRHSMMIIFTNRNQELEADQSIEKRIRDKTMKMKMMRPISSA